MFGKKGNADGEESKMDEDDIDDNVALGAVLQRRATQKMNEDEANDEKNKVLKEMENDFKTDGGENAEKDAVEEKTKDLDVYDKVLYEALRAKKIVKFDQDIYALTYLSFLRVTVKKFRIDKKKHS